MKTLLLYALAPLLGILVGAGISAAIMQVAAGPAPITEAGKLWPPWFTYMPVATDPNGPNLLILGQLHGGRTLGVSAYRLQPGAAAQIIIGSVADNLPVGAGKLVPHPTMTIPLKADQLGVLLYDLHLPATLPPSGKLYVQLRTKLAGKLALTNAVAIDFAKAPAP